MSLQTPRKQANRDKRLRIQTLYFNAELTEEQIATKLHLTRAQVRYAIDYRLTPQCNARGRKALLDMPYRKRLVEWVTTSEANRCVR